jgi:hypothetical protein
MEQVEVVGVVCSEEEANEAVRVVGRASKEVSKWWKRRRGVRPDGNGRESGGGRGRGEGEGEEEEEEEKGGYKEAIQEPRFLGEEGLREQQWRRLIHCD